MTVDSATRVAAAAVTAILQETQTHGNAFALLRQYPVYSIAYGVHFEFHRLEEQISAEAALDGIYAIRTSVPKKRMSAADAVRNYKALANVERAYPIPAPRSGVDRQDPRVDRIPTAPPTPCR